MLEGYSRDQYNKLGGLITSLPATQVPSGSAIVCEDIEFTPRTIKTRSGLTQLFQAPSNASIKGLDVLIRQAVGTSNATQMLLAYASDGKLYKEDFAGAGTLSLISNLGVNDLFMQMSTGYDKAYMGFSDLITGQAAPKQYLQYQNQYYLDPVGIAPATVAQAVAMRATQFTGGQPGDIPVGTFYCVVLFMTRSGYISGILDNAQLTITTTVVNEQLVMANIPLGPAGTVARILAFTEPGISSLGPYYYIPDSYTVVGMNHMVTSTMINDNTTTSLPVNFSPDALRSGLEVTQFFDKMLVPNVVGTKFLPSLRRIAYWGSSTEPSTAFFSEPDDPETLFASLSRVFVAENDGQRIQTIFEFRSEIYVAKERGGFVLDPTNTFPATWSVNERWTGVGPCGPRALDRCEEFVFFVHRSGAYRYEGGSPEWVSWEHAGDEGLWKRINWAFGHLISVKIDTESKRIFISVPLDQATVPNKIIVLDYRLGFSSPVVQDDSANLVSSDGRKWSIYNIPAYQVIRAERPITGLQPTLDNTLQSTQLLLGSSMKDGAINMFDTLSPRDNGKGIMSIYQPAYRRPSGVVQIGGVDVQVRGNGVLGITQMADEDSPTEKPPLAIKNGQQIMYTIKTRGQSTIWGLRLHSVNEGDSWEIGELALWLRSMWAWSRS